MKNREAFSSRLTGLIGALFLSVSLLDVYHSHYILTDIPMVLFLTFGLVFCVRVAKEGRGRDIVMAAVAIGLSAGSKYPGVFLLPILILAVFINKWSYFYNRGERKWPAFIRGFSKGLIPVCLIMGVFGLALFLTNPYLLLDFDHSRAGIRDVLHWMGKGHFFFRYFTPWKSYLFEALGFGVGWPILILGAGGLLISLYKRKPIGILLGLTASLFFIVFSLMKVVYYRYTLPLLPPLCVLAAWTVVELVGSRPLLRKGL